MQTVVWSTVVIEMLNGQCFPVYINIQGCHFR